MKWSKMLVLGIGMVLLLFAAACGNGNTEEEGQEDAESEETEQPATDTNDTEKAITIGLDPYAYSTVPAYLSKVILENEGYDVEIQEAEVGILFAALAEGDIDAYIDIWGPNLQSNYLEKYDGQFDIIGTLYSDAPIGLAVPKYMEEVNSIADLKEHKDEFDGMIYAIDAGSGTDQTTRKLIEAYNLDYEITNSSTPAMVAQAKRRMDNNEAVVFNAWRPHTMFKLLDIKMLDEPKNVFGSDDVQIGTIFGLEEKAPEAYTLFSNMELSLDEIEEWLLDMEQEGKKPADLAVEWVEEQPDRVDQWLEK